MSEQITIVCPHCNFSKSMPAGSIPASAATATCPSCKQSFRLCPETLFTASPISDCADAQDGVLPPPLPPKTGPSQSGTVHEALPEQPINQSPQLLDFQFKGTAGEYFGIWIVNTLLKIVTVGIYSAWAKVRMRRFFYGSTSLQGQSFEYLANPVTLFKGWLIAAVAFILYAVTSKINPLLSAAVGLLIFIAFPWLLVRSRIFNNRNSSYRNIRFGFKADYGEAYLIYAGLPILSLLSLGIMFPYMLYRQKKFMVEKSSYGTTPFTFTATAKDFYILCLKVFCGFVVIAIMLGALMVFISGGVSALKSSGGRPHIVGAMAFLPLISMFMLYFLVMVYGQTIMSNLCWNNTRLKGNIFISKLKTFKMAWLFVTNALAIMFSLGLMMPWATVRMARYRFETLSVLGDGSIESVMAAAANMEAVSATGEEIGDVFDMPIDIGL